MIDKHTLAFADFKGNRQFISQGNLAENSRAYLFLIDYAERKRIKIWGDAQIVEDDPELLDTLMPSRESYRALPEQVIKFTVSVWDRNCPQHIPVKIDEEDVLAALTEKDDEIAQLKQQLAMLQTTI